MTLDNAPNTIPDLTPYPAESIGTHNTTLCMNLSLDLLQEILGRDRSPNILP